MWSDSPESNVARSPVGKVIRKAFTLAFGTAPVSSAQSLVQPAGNGVPPVVSSSRHGFADDEYSMKAPTGTVDMSKPANVASQSLFRGVPTWV